MSDLMSQITSSMGGLKQEFNIIAHNLANVGTVGYKRRCNTFSRSLVAQGAGSQAETDGEVDLESVFDFTQGPVKATDRSLDFALVGKGFFVIETPDGPLYTRNGMFRLDSNGQIVDTAGRLVAGESGPITIPANVGISQVSVSSDGSITAGGVSAGKFRLIDFGENEKDLVSAGMNCFHASGDARPEAPKNLIVKQGFQEGSNVQMVEEMVDMMMVSRLYEANMQFVSSKSSVSKSIIDVAMS
ncbi:MAG: flagellar hook basal-body protein [Sedimentisphaerales bacterium]|nr:flagellar hook basal-body protein [Sedimentisphaerales bacterium]